MDRAKLTIHAQAKTDGWGSRSGSTRVGLGQNGGRLVALRTDELVVLVVTLAEANRKACGEPRDDHRHTYTHEDQHCAAVVVIRGGLGTCRLKGRGGDEDLEFLDGLVRLDLEGLPNATSFEHVGAIGEDGQGKLAVGTGDSLRDLLPLVVGHPDFLIGNRGDSVQIQELTLDPGLLRLRSRGGSALGGWGSRRLLAVSWCGRLLGISGGGSRLVAGPRVLLREGAREGHAKQCQVGRQHEAEETMQAAHVTPHASAYQRHFP